MRRTAIGVVILALTAVASTPAQQVTTKTTTTTTTTTTKTLGAAMNVYVFPQKGQSSTTQSVDETACYNWAVKNTGSDPFQLMRKQQAQAQQTAAAQGAAAQTGEGWGLRGAAGGAAGGALFGAIGGNAGAGAAIGAATGLVFGRVRARQAQSAAEEAAEKSAAAEKATAQQIENFKKAFSVCLEGKNYLVKY
jgi:hypothetical protein